MAGMTGSFFCSGCGREFAWKPDLVGKRIACKCGTKVDVPEKVVAPDRRAAKASSTKPSVAPPPQKAPQPPGPKRTAPPPPLPPGVARPPQQAPPPPAPSAFDDLDAGPLAANGGGYELSGPNLTRPAGQGIASDGSPVRSKRKRLKPVMGIPPRVGFGFAAVGITCMLGGLIFAFLPAILVPIEVMNDKMIDLYERCWKPVLFAMSIGPLLCLVAPSNWNARALALIASIIGFFLCFNLTFDDITFSRSRDLIVLLVLAAAAFPFVICAFLDKFGEGLHSAGLSHAAKRMSYFLIVMVTVTLGVGRIGSILGGGVNVVRVAMLVPVVLLSIVVYIAFNVIVAVLDAAFVHAKR